MRDEYIQDIKDKLEKAKIVTAGTSCDMMLKYLPDDNLEMISKRLKHFRAYAEFLDLRRAIDNYGWTKYKPYFVYDEESDDNPTLCVEFDRFLHMFRGYYFQLSATPDGVGSHGITAISTQSLVKLAAQYDNSGKSKLIYSLLYAAMIDCGFQSPNFRWAFNTNRDVIDDFFRRSMKYWGISTEYDFSTISGLITESHGVIKPESDEDIVYEYRQGSKPYCRFRVNDDKIDVEYVNTSFEGDIQESTIISMRIPDVKEGMVPDNMFAKALGSMSGKEYGDVNADEMRDELPDIFGNNAKPKHMLLMMLLKFAGFHACWYTMYRISSNEPLQEIENEKYVNVESCREFIN